MTYLRATWGRLNEASSVVGLSRFPVRAWMVVALLVTFASGSLVAELGSRVEPVRGGTIIGSMCVLTALAWWRYNVLTFRPLQRRARHQHDQIMCELEDQADLISDQAQQIDALRTQLRLLEDRLPLPYPEQRQPSRPAPISE
jgi:hypothetical protein